MTTLNIHASHHDAMNKLTARVEPKESNPFITMVITDEHMHFIGGKSDHLMMITLDNDEYLQPSQWSVSASAFKNFWDNHQQHIKKKQTVTLELTTSKESDFPLLEGVTNHHSFRYLQATQPNTAHMAFYDALTAKNYRELPTDKAKEICALADDCRPFQTFELNKDDHTIRIERDHKVVPIDVPVEIEIDFNMVLTADAQKDMALLAHSTQQEMLSVYLDDELAVFTDGHQVFSHSLSDLQSYREKKQRQFDEEARLIIEIFGFKRELANFRKIDEIRRANQVLLYITPTDVYFASMHPQVGSVMLLTVEQVFAQQEQLYSINLNALSRVPIKDITRAGQVKMTVRRNDVGEIELGFHNDKDKEHAYHSVPMEIATSMLPELLPRIERAKALDSGHFGDQMDMLGFDDV